MQVKPVEVKLKKLTLTEEQLSSLVEPDVSGRLDELDLPCLKGKKIRVGVALSGLISPFLLKKKTD